MNAKSFIKVGLLSVSTTAVNVGSVFGWECSKGHEHKKDEICTETFPMERPCNDPMCDSNYHTIREVCPQSVFGFRSEGIKYVILPWCVPEGKIAELWFEYRYSDVKRDGRYGEYCPKIELDQNIEVQRLELRVGKLKEKFLKGSPKYLKKQERLKKTNDFIQKRQKESKAKRNNMINAKEIEKIKREEEYQIKGLERNS